MTTIREHLLSSENMLIYLDFMSKLLYLTVRISASILLKAENEGKKEQKAYGV